MRKPERQACADWPLDGWVACFNAELPHSGTLGLRPGSVPVVGPVGPWDPSADVLG